MLDTQDESVNIFISSRPESSHFLMVTRLHESLLDLVLAPLGVRHGDQPLLELLDVGDGLEHQVQVTGGRLEVREAASERSDLLPLARGGEDAVVFPHQPLGAQLAGRGLKLVEAGKGLAPASFKWRAVTSKWRGPVPLTPWPPPLHAAWTLILMLT